MTNIHLQCIGEDLCYWCDLSEETTMNHCRLYNEDCRTWVHTNTINKTRRIDVISTTNICMYLQCTGGLGWEIVWIIVRFLLLTWLGSGNIWLKVSFANFFVCVELNEQKIWTCCYFLLVWPRHIDSRPLWNIRFDLTFFLMCDDLASCTSKDQNSSSFLPFFVHWDKILTKTKILPNKSIPSIFK